MAEKPKMQMIQDVDRGIYVRLSCGCIVTRKSAQPVERWTGNWEYKPGRRLRKVMVTVVAVTVKTPCVRSVFGQKVPRKERQLVSLNCRLIKSGRSGEYITLSQSPVRIVEDQLAATLEDLFK